MNKKQMLIQTDNIYPPQLHMIDIDIENDNYQSFLEKIYNIFNLDKLRNNNEHKLVIYSSQSGILYRKQLNESNWKSFDNAWLFVY